MRNDTSTMPLLLRQSGVLSTDDAEERTLQFQEIYIFLTQSLRFSNNSSRDYILSLSHLLLTNTQVQAFTDGYRHIYSNPEKLYAFKLKAHSTQWLFSTCRTVNATYFYNRKEDPDHETNVLA